MSSFMNNKSGSEDNMSQNISVPCRRDKTHCQACCDADLICTHILSAEPTYADLQKLCEEQRGELDKWKAVYTCCKSSPDCANNQLKKLTEELLGEVWSDKHERLYCIMESIETDRDMAQSQLAEWKRTGCRACGGDKGHYEGCHGEAPLVIENEQLRFQLAEKEKEIELLRRMTQNDIVQQLMVAQNQLATQTAEIERLTLLNRQDIVDAIKPFKESWEKELATQTERVRKLTEALKLTEFGSCDACGSCRYCPVCGERSMIRRGHDSECCVWQALNEGDI